MCGVTSLPSIPAELVQREGGRKGGREGGNEEGEREGGREGGREEALEGKGEEAACEQEKEEKTLMTHHNWTHVASSRACCMAVSISDPSTLHLSGMGTAITTPDPIPSRRLVSARKSWCEL